MGNTLQMLNVDTLNAKYVLADSLGDKSTGFGLFNYTDHPVGLSLDGIASVLFWALLMVGLVYLFHKKESWFRFFSRNLTSLFALAWTMGFVVYDIGMYHNQSADWWHALSCLLGTAPMAIIYAFEMFLFQSDISAIYSGYRDSSWFMFFFSVPHFFAAFISLIFVVKHFGFNIVATISRLWNTRMGIIQEKEKLYVFWGMNDATYYLAKDIINKDKLVDGRIIIVRIPNEKEDADKPIGIERLSSFMSMTTNDLEHLRELQNYNCLTTNTFGLLTNIQASDGDEILSKELKLHSLVKLIRHTTKEIHMFFLGDDEVFNIEAVATLWKDKELQGFAKKKVEKEKEKQEEKENNKIRVRFYCHARYNSIHRVIEDELAAEKMEVRVIDSSRISVELLKDTAALHPVRYVDIKNDATVSSPFNALVVGFGEVGMDAVRFLYEFGAFVKYKYRVGTVERSAFHCHVIDPQMNDIAGVFTVNAPSIATTLNRREQDVSKSLNLYNLDCKSVEFYNRLEKWIKTLNYVVVATGDDETNISLAVRILRLAIRYRENGLGQFVILVRVRHDENGHIQKIQKHYNRIWAADMNRIDGQLYQCVIKKDEEKDAPIYLFGSMDKVYSYENVVKEKLKEDAKKFKENYARFVNKSRREAGKEPKEIEDWDEERALMMQLTGEYKDYAPTYSNIMKLRRVQSQNIANSHHKETKKWLAQTALGTQCYAKLKENGLVRKYDSKTYAWRNGSAEPINDIQRVMDVLAQTEHLRWSASHEILGYQMGKDDDKSREEAKLLHGCLKEWENLQDETKRYDYNIVDLSLNLAPNDKEAEQEQSTT